MIFHSEQLKGISARTNWHDQQDLRRMFKVALTENLQIAYSTALKYSLEKGCSAEFNRTALE